MRIIWNVVSNPRSKWFAVDVTRGTGLFQFNKFSPVDDALTKSISTGFTLDLLTFGFAMEWWDN